MDAKNISKIYKLIAPLGAIICAVLKWLGILPGASINEICTLWACIYAIGAGTIDANIIIDKFTGGNKNEQKNI